jgi:Tfp pilus assembly protein PilF
LKPTVEAVLDRSHRHWGRRQRRLRRAAWGLAALLLVAAAVGWWSYRRARPEVRRPGEDLAEITSRLASDLPAAAPVPQFSNVTEESGLGDFVTFRGERTSQLPEDMGAGAAWGDFDNDGDDDLFLVGAGGAMSAPPENWADSALFENRGDGTFRRVTGFPEVRLLGMAAAWGDVDGDGWQDLVVTGYDAIVLLRNHEGRFERDDGLNRPGYWAGAAWGDFDNDRDLDLYVCGYVRYDIARGGRERVSDQYGTAVPYTLNPASFEPESNLLFENDGSGRFQEVALLYGVSDQGGRSLTALWHDFDADGRLDLYVANDISDNALYLNRGDTFEDAGLAAWVADYRGAMGLAAGDWNRDGDDDLFVTHWIAQENALYDSRLNAAPQPPTQLPPGQLPPGQEPLAAAPRPLAFSDVAAPAGLGQIALQSIGWGTGFADLDSDGWLDLVVVNGSTFETKTPPKVLERQPPFLFWNEEGRRFHDLAPGSAAFAPGVGRGLALSDYDNDGDVDVLVVTLDDGVRLLRNEMQHGNWLEVELRSALPGGSWGPGDGATVVVTVGGVALRRTVTSASYLSQHSRVLHFGLGAATTIESVEVHWLAGGTQSFGGLEVDGRWRLTEGEASAERVLLGQRERVTAFWQLQREAMDAMKRDGDSAAAMALFERALELNPRHEDSRYYLANLLAAQGDLAAAQNELAEVIEANPQSHRAYKQQGVLRALYGRGDEDLAAAQAALETAVALNPEETGGLLALGEVLLLRGDEAAAEGHFVHACRSNPRAVGGFFLRAYISWRRGDSAGSADLLRQAMAARGPEWKPEGAVAEGDVARRMHREESPLAQYWQSWDGVADPARAFASLDARLGRRG